MTVNQSPKGSIFMLPSEKHVQNWEPNVILLLMQGFFFLFTLFPLISKVFGLLSALQNAPYRRCYLAVVLSYLETIFKEKSTAEMRF